MSADFHIVIPARYQSSRLPGKLLKELNGKTVLERTYQQALKAKPSSIIIATDHDLIYQYARQINAPVMMTDITHQSGTDRIAEVVKKQGYEADAIIVNVQGDEPLINPLLIQQVANTLAMSDVPMATLCWPIEDKAMRDNPNVVKVVRDKSHNALYFSRSAIPAHRDQPEESLSQLYRHIGLYAYRARFLLEIVSHPVCELERLEALEQLRVLWAGYKIKVEQACCPPLQDINTEEDLLAAAALM